jgi:hypothetical protein
MLGRVIHSAIAMGAARSASVIRVRPRSFVKRDDACPAKADVVLHVESDIVHLPMVGPRS